MKIIFNLNYFLEEIVKIQPYKIKEKLIIITQICKVFIQYIYKKKTTKRMHICENIIQGL